MLLSYTLFLLYYIVMKESHSDKWIMSHLVEIPLIINETWQKWAE